MDNLWPPLTRPAYAGILLSPKGERQFMGCKLFEWTIKISMHSPGQHGSQMGGFQGEVLSHDYQVLSNSPTPPPGICRLLLSPKGKRQFMGCNGLIAWISRRRKSETRCPMQYQNPNSLSGQHASNIGGLSGGGTHPDSWNKNETERISSSQFSHSPVAYAGFLLSPQGERQFMGEQVVWMNHNKKTFDIAIWREGFAPGKKE